MHKSLFLYIDSDGIAHYMLFHRRGFTELEFPFQVYNSICNVDVGAILLTEKNIVKDPNVYSFSEPLLVKRFCFWHPNIFCIQFFKFENLGKAVVSSNKLVQEKWEKTLQVIPEGVLIMDKPTNKINYYNSELKAIIGSDYFEQSEDQEQLISSLLKQYKIQDTSESLQEGQTIDGLNDDGQVLRQGKNLTFFNQQKMSLWDYLTQFIVSTAHELRTPLNSIIPMSENLRPYIQGEAGQNILKVIINSTIHLSLIIEDALDMSRIENNKFEINYSLFNLKNTIDEVIDIMKFQADLKGLKIISNIDASLPQTVYTDEKRYKQVLFNLIGNAMKFTLKGSIIVKVTLIQADFIQTKVIDTGIGISTPDLKKLFCQFGKLSSPNKINQCGMGLGLSISKQIIEQLGGQISVKSQVCKGTSFKFTIKLEPQQSELTRMNAGIYELYDSNGGVQFHLINRSSQICQLEQDVQDETGQWDIPETIDDDDNKTQNLLQVEPAENFQKINKIINTLNLESSQQGEPNHQNNLPSLQSNFSLVDNALPDDTSLSNRFNMNNYNSSQGKLLISVNDKYQSPLLLPIQVNRFQRAVPSPQFIQRKNLLRFEKIDRRPSAGKNMKNGNSLNQKMRILIVDDQVYNILVLELLLKNLLSDQAFEIDKVLNGQEAIEKILEQNNSNNKSKANHYNAIFLDIQMPIMDGISTIKEIRKLQVLGNISMDNTLVYALTASTKQEFTMMYGEQQFDGYGKYSRKLNRSNPILQWKSQLSWNILRKYQKNELEYQ
ncbi:multi-sensor hybrid histidine kinase [Stylonychia lemnae]|uniref:Multi-sensor hybrid histidine kinase n=1 Tax=Stylonychia lemnae TaxID=5949 RepID=A0A077ZTA7_STYLE|nr:multi-sensor hybrid histidine kinase [Stylonychia lemnae]|eukprot:CDW71696.1 multi-sensor hybrid histidine kinase [Stylonychia lemnae]